MNNNTGTHHSKVSMGDTQKVVRFAPSPTGHLHIGGLRTALFNYLYIKNQGGTFILRIEDTDVTRSTRQMADEIIKGMQWLGLHWDQGPFFQSDNFETYRQTAFQLLEQGHAYRCFCSAEELDARKQASRSQEKSQQLYKYDRQCLGLNQEQIQRRLDENKPFVIRFLVPDGVTYFKDRIHKEMKTENSELDDFVILKSDQSPTYHLSVVVDDSNMEITDVIRGDDHLSNTFKQVLLFKALGLKPPKYAHLPLILGPDKKKLSKRHGETSVLEFKKLGYLPEALINYLSQLSWLPADSKTIIPTQQLIKQFNLSKLSKNSPVFDYDKLRFLNGKAIQQKSAAQLLQLLLQHYPFMTHYAHIEKDKKEALIQLVKPRLKLVNEFEEKFRLYFSQSMDYAQQEHEIQKLNQNYDNPAIVNHLNLLLPCLQDLDPFDHHSVEAAVRQCASQNNLQAADFIHPARFALTMETVSPSIFDLFAFFGRAESIRRIKALTAYLNTK